MITTLLPLLLMTFEMKKRPFLFSRSLLYPFESWQLGSFGLTAEVELSGLLGKV